ncbi:chromosomal replication initiator protein DnaA [Chloroflexota bacterium]
MEARSAQEIWETTLGELQIQVNKINYRTWLEKTVGLSYQDNLFIVGVPNAFVAEYLDKNQRSLIEKTLIGLTRRDLKVTFSVDAKEQSLPGSYNAQEEISSAAQIAPPRFNPKYTFDSFVVSSCNRLAHASALGVAENPKRSYNPLFIFGGVGLGKTHLLHAIGHTALASNIQVLYVSGEQFTNEFINAIRDRKTEGFRDKFRSVDVLLIDDIQFISGKEQTEECFFHTFNELHNANHQIVLTCDRPPKSIPRLQERLCSRFEWGLIADIQPPDFETRLAILQAKAELVKADITSDVLEFLAQRIQQNIRELEGNLNRVIAYARLVRTSITPESAARALEDLATRAPKDTPPTPTLVLEAVADSFQVATADLKGRRRDKEIALARQVVMYLIKQETNYSLVQIGRELGGRNPSTISHACEKIATDIDASPYLRRQISDIHQKIYPKPKGRNF